jgi:hypothetical protein
MEMSGQFHAPAALLKEKSPLVPTALSISGALSDERTGLSLVVVTVSGNKSVVSKYNLHFTCPGPDTPGMDAFSL